VPKWQISRLRLTIYDPKAHADVEDNFRKTLGQLFGGRCSWRPSLPTTNSRKL
jgi:hypothetical protein